MAALNFNKIIVLVGMPGSGKGTLAAMCVKRLGWRQLSTGELCRKHVASHTEIGKKIDFAIKSGKLVSDSIISEMVFDWLVEGSGSSEVVIFDGFPRTVEQAKSLDKFLCDKFGDDAQVLNVVRLVVSEQIVKDRVIHRVICSNKDCQAGYSLSAGSAFYPKQDNVCDKCGAPLIRRADDSGISVESRLDSYRLNEGQLLSFFEESGYPVVNLEAGLEAEVVFDNLMRILQV